MHGTSPTECCDCNLDGKVISMGLVVLQLPLTLVRFHVSFFGSDTLMKYLFLWLLPALAECVIVCVIFATYFQYTPLAGKFLGSCWTWLPLRCWDMTLPPTIATHIFPIPHPPSSQTKIIKYPCSILYGCTLSGPSL